MLYAVLNRMKCEAEQRAEERAREAVARKLTTGKSQVASKVRKRSPATRHGEQALGRLSRLFDIGCAKSETLKETMVRYSFE